MHGSVLGEQVDSNLTLLGFQHGLVIGLRIEAANDANLNGIRLPLPRGPVDRVGARLGDVGNDVDQVENGSGDLSGTELLGKRSFGKLVCCFDGQRFTFLSSHTEAVSEITPPW